MDGAFAFRLAVGVTATFGYLVAYEYVGGREDWSQLRRALLRLGLTVALLGVYVSLAPA